MGVMLSEEVETLARELAAITHEELEIVLLEALHERLDKLKQREQETAQERDFRLQAWLNRVDSRPRTEDPRTWKQLEDEELYDEAGLPIG